MSDGFNRLTHHRYLAILPTVQAVRTKIVPVAVQIEQKAAFTKPPPSISKPGQSNSLAMIEKFKIVTVYKPTMRRVIVDDAQLKVRRAFDRVKNLPERTPVHTRPSTHRKDTRRRIAITDLLRSVQILRAQRAASLRRTLNNRYREEALRHRMLMEDAAVRHKFFEGMNLRYMR